MRKLTKLIALFLIVMFCMGAITSAFGATWNIKLKGASDGSKPHKYCEIYVSGYSGGYVHYHILKPWEGWHRHFSLPYGYRTVTVLDRPDYVKYYVNFSSNNQWTTLAVPRLGQRG